MHSRTLSLKAASLLALFGLCALAPLAQAQSVVSLRLEGLIGGITQPADLQNPGFSWDTSSLPTPGVVGEAVPFTMTLDFEIMDSGLSATTAPGGSSFVFPFKGLEFSAGDFDSEIRPSMLSDNMLPLASLGASVQPTVPLASFVALGSDPASADFSPLPIDPFGSGNSIFSLIFSFGKDVPNPGPSPFSTDHEFLEFYAQNLTPENFDPLTATDFSGIGRLTGLFQYVGATNEVAVYGFDGVVTNAHVIPEPSVTALLFGGLAALVVVARRRFR